MLVSSAVWVGCEVLPSWAWKGPMRLLIVGFAIKLVSRSFDWLRASP